MNDQDRYVIFFFHFTVRAVTAGKKPFFRTLIFGPVLPSPALERGATTTGRW